MAPPAFLFRGSMNLQARKATRAARWGMLITSISVGLMLVASSLLGYLGARDGAQSVARVRAMDMLSAARRVLLTSGTKPEQAESLLADMQVQGLQSVSLVNPSGETTLLAGTPVFKQGQYQRRPAAAGPQVLIDWDENRIQATGPLMAGRGRVLNPGRRGAGRGRFDGRGKDRRLLVLEFEPLAAGSLISRAAWTLALSLVVAALALAGSLVFFRLSSRADWFRNQLEREKKLAALGEMSAVLGHELRNPLTALKGHAQLLLERLSADHPGHKGAETVVNEATRMEKLTNEVLEFARTGKLERKPGSARKVVEAALAEWSPERIKLEIAPALPEWPMDSRRMQRVISNLVGNALEASPKDTPVEIQVWLESECLLFQVRDHGAGLKPGEQQRVFEPFYTSRVQGTGLGLAVALRIVDGHEGTIRADNHPDGGAEFTVRLPPA